MAREARWERKSLPLGFITLSLRQLTTIAISFVAAFIVSLPFQFPIAGFSFGGRAGAFCMIFGVGYVVSSRRVRMLPVELQALYLLRTRGLGKLRLGVLNPLSSGKSKENLRETRQSPVVLEMLVEDFKNPIPLVVSDRVKNIPDETRVLLLLDDQVRAEEPVSPQRSHFSLAYVPLPQDIGKHTLTVKLADSSEPFTTFGLSLTGRTSIAKDEPIAKEE